MTGITGLRGHAQMAVGLTTGAFALSLAALVSMPTSAAAQQLRALPPAGDLPQSQFGRPGSGNPGSSLLPPSAPTPPPPAPTPVQAVPQVPAGQVALMATARFGREAPQPITGGLLWRVYPTKPDAAGVFRALKEDRNAAPTFVLPPGPYVIHVSFGLAHAVKNVTLRSETVREVFDIPAGAIRIGGRVGDVPIPPSQISFDIYPGSQFDPSEKQQVAQNVATGEVVIVPEGTYYIVSNYGDGNAVVRSDIRVQTSKLTDVTVTHRAAVITLKLVGERGGEALANTNWTVLTPGGDVIKESIGAFPKVVLAEGDYRAIARYEGKNYDREFKVVNGVDGEIEVLAK
jgi:hypothetical protein